VVRNVGKDASEAPAMARRVRHVRSITSLASHACYGINSGSVPGCFANLEKASARSDSNSKANLLYDPNVLCENHKGDAADAAHCMGLTVQRP